MRPSSVRTRGPHRPRRAGPLQDDDSAVGTSRGTLRAAVAPGRLLRVMSYNVKDFTADRAAAARVVRTLRLTCCASRRCPAG